MKSRLVGDEVREEVRSPGRGSPGDLSARDRRGTAGGTSSFVRSLQRPWDESFAGCRTLMPMVNVNTHGPSPTFSALGVLIEGSSLPLQHTGRHFVQEKLKWPAHLITEY